MALFWLFALFIFFVLGPVARAYAERVRRGGGGELPGAPPQEVGRLREEVDRLGAEVARLSDEQAFMLRLLAPGERKQGPEGQPPAGPPPAA